MLPTAYHNPMGLLTRGKLSFGDCRNPPGGALLPGDDVILRVAVFSVPTDEGQIAYEFLTVETTSITGPNQFCGEVIVPPIPQIIPPALLRMGSPMAFSMEHVLTILKRRKRQSL